MSDFFQPRDVVHRPRNGKREHLTVSTAVKQLTPSAYTVNAKDMPSANSFATQIGLPAKMASAAVIQVLNQPLNFTTEGTDPTTGTTGNVGFQALAGDKIYLNTTQEIVNFKAVKQGATDSEIEVQYFFGF